MKITQQNKVGCVVNGPRLTAECVSAVLVWEDNGNVWIVRVLEVRLAAI